MGSIVLDPIIDTIVLGLLQHGARTNSRHHKAGPVGNILLDPSIGSIGI